MYEGWPTYARPSTQPLRQSTVYQHQTYVRPQISIKALPTIAFPMSAQKPQVRIVKLGQKIPVTLVLKSPGDHLELAGQT